MNKHPALCSNKSVLNCGLYYKHTTIANYVSSVVNKLKALLTDDVRVVIYDRHVFIVQATGLKCASFIITQLYENTKDPLSLLFGLYGPQKKMFKFDFNCAVKLF